MKNIDIRNKFSMKILNELRPFSFVGAIESEIHSDKFSIDSYGFVDMEFVDRINIVENRLIKQYVDELLH